MDPVANLREQLELAPWVLKNSELYGGVELDCPGRLAELVMSLDEWRRKGGFDPYAVQPGASTDHAA